MKYSAADKSAAVLARGISHSQACFNGPQLATSVIRFCRRSSVHLWQSPTVTLTEMEEEHLIQTCTIHCVDLSPSLSMSLQSYESYDSIISSLLRAAAHSWCPTSSRQVAAPRASRQLWKPPAVDCGSP